MFKNFNLFLWVFLYDWIVFNLLTSKIITYLFLYYYHCRDKLKRTFNFLNMFIDLTGHFSSAKKKQIYKRFCFSVITKTITFSYIFLLILKQIILQLYCQLLSKNFSHFLNKQTWVYGRSCGSSPSTTAGARCSTFYNLIGLESIRCSLSSGPSLADWSTSTWKP